MYLLDSNTCIQYLNGNSHDVERRLMQSKPSTIKLCSIVKAELWYGARRSNNPDKALARIERFFAPYESIPFDDDAAVEYGRIRGHLAASGTPIGPNDLLIAAIALSRQVTVVTHNTREFARVPGLAVEDWELPDQLHA
jgi:tRNA(fMet)-specific endonuclease VapC